MWFQNCFNPRIKSSHEKKAYRNQRRFIYLPYLWKIGNIKQRFKSTHKNPFVQNCEIQMWRLLICWSKKGNNVCSLRKVSCWKFRVWPLWIYHKKFRRLRNTFIYLWNVWMQCLLWKIINHLRDKHDVKKAEKVGGIMHIKMERSEFTEVMNELLGKHSFK